MAPVAVNRWGRPLSSWCSIIPDASLGGEYARYAEISIKRKVTRDGQSFYFLNGNKCRRRDITDIFLGTGLGPRSYAIIEQGMISRLIEAKPDELRVFIEEAAGISKYKDRRRDTENRMRRTQENLERLTDIRDELGRQIQRLERQAKAAEKYTELKNEERQVKAELQALRWREMSQELGSQQQVISEHELQVEALVTERVGCDTALEKHRTGYTELTDRFNEVQGRYYSVGAEVARIEQAIKHAEDRARDLQREIDETERSFVESEKHLSLDKERFTALRAEMVELLPQLEEISEQDEVAAEALQIAEQEMHDWQTAWDEFNQSSNKPRQQAEVQQSRIQHLEQVMQRLTDRLVGLVGETDGLDEGPASQQVAELEAQLEELEQNTESQQQQLEEVEQQSAEAKVRQSELVEQLDQQRTRLQQGLGRKASLEALQQSALDSDSGAKSWVEKQGLQSAVRLAEQLQVKKGWESAVEAVLGNYLQAVCVDSIEQYAEQLSSFDQGELLLTSAANISAAGGQGDTLESKVTGGSTAGLLAGVYAADSLSQALAMRANLKAGESVVTADGIWLGAGWLRLVKDRDQNAGVLQRKQQLEELTAEVEQFQETIEQQQQAKTEVEESLQQFDQQRRELAAKQGEQQRQYAELRSQLSASRVQIQQVAERRERLEQDITEAREQEAQERENLAEARQLLEESIELMEEDKGRREELLQQRDQRRSTLDNARQSARHYRDKQHELAIREKSVSTQVQSIQESMTRLESQVTRLQERREELAATSEDTEDPAASLREEQEGQLELRLKAEAEMTEARKEVEAVEHDMRDTEKRRMTIENQLQEQRSQLEAKRMQHQELRTRAATVEEQVSGHGFDLNSLLEQLHDESDLQAWEEKLQLIGNRIQRLGAINLAAIEEFKVESERKTYLDEQNSELEEALQTLENAIRKIDKETRTRFKETFYKLNSSLQELFPRVFGGGHAYLELTGDDLLDTGVAIMARPPGKKNTTIHLLSGGEKAMTAIALVFSIFQLNPAPFCMLDEVDAPLDDANVGRYARMVHEMSEKVQFIYITHNKIAMEMAHQLMGVTMHEPGVSRLVTVDVDQAVEMATA